MTHDKATCVESDECVSTWHYWRCPKHDDYGNPINHDKATGGRTGAAAVDQAIADVRDALDEYHGYTAADPTEPSKPAYAALRVLADAVEELRRRLALEYQVRLDTRAMLEAAEAERDYWKRQAGEYQEANATFKHQGRDLRDAEAENVRLARQVADLEAPLESLIQWNDRWPRIYGSEDIKRVAAEIDAVVAEARAALAKENQ